MERDCWRRIFCECRRAANKAYETVSRNVPEDEWQSFMTVHIFQRFCEGQGSLLDG